MADITDAAAYPWPPPPTAKSQDEDEVDPMTEPEPEPMPEPVTDTAITITVEDFQAESGIPATDVRRAQRLIAVASERVNRYAPLAPTVIKNEAVLRFGSFLGSVEPGNVASEAIGPRSVTYTSPTTNASAFRSSGAAALLSSYKVRRAGSISG